MRRPLADRLWEGVDKRGPDECWNWTRGLNRANGYGKMTTGKTTVLVHRLSYELLVGPIPAGLTIDHLCRNHRCVNPAHLEPVSQAENVRRGVGPTTGNAAKTHCVNGHEFTPENTMAERGWRKCRVCHNAAATRSYAKKLAAKRRELGIE